MNFLEVYFNGVLKHSLPVQNNVISIGRASNNDVVINNMGVSSQHAIISKKNDLFYIEDLNSTNGTFVNSQKITSQQRVNLQDTIIIGKHTIKFSEWGQSQNSAAANPVMDAPDATIMMRKNDVTKNSPTTEIDAQSKSFYLILRGEHTGINKLLLTNNSYGIGKRKDNDIRVDGWFTPAYIADIDRVGHSFYINPLKKNKVKLNGEFINSSTLLTNSDEIKIKNLFLKFLSD